MTFSETDAARVSGDPIAHSLDDLRQECDLVTVRLKTIYGWPDTDRRVEAIHRLRNVAQSLLAAFAFHRAIFPTESFWQTFFIAVPNSREFEDHYREFDVLIRFSGLQGMFSAAESDLRAVVATIDPTACGGATAEFDSVAQWLFARATTAAPFQKFVDLLRLTRNTIHSNGVHRPRNSKDVSMTLAGKEYKFIVGNAIDFVNWAFVILVGQQLVALMETVARDPLVAALPEVAGTTAT